MLAGVNEGLIVTGARQGVADRRGLDELRARPDDADDLQASASSAPPLTR